MFPTKIARGAGSGGSVPVECCQICGLEPLQTVLSLGYMPPVNQMVAIGEVQKQQTWFPTNLMHCSKCELVQLGVAVDPVIIFPPEYPYTSGMTRILRENFAELYAEFQRCLGFGPDDLCGRHRIERRHADLELPERRPSGFSASSRPTSRRSPMDEASRHCSATSRKRSRVRSGRSMAPRRWSPRPIVSPTSRMSMHRRGIVEMLAPDGVFISELHYLIGLLDDLQYDTVYHEHSAALYRSAVCAHLLGMHGLGGVPRPQDPDPWRIDPGLCRAQGHSTGPAQRGGNADQRASRRSDAQTPRHASATTSCSPRSGFMR